jgi:hypothetical protein
MKGHCTGTTRLLRLLLLPLALATGCSSDDASRNIEADYVLLGADSTVSPTFAEARIVVSDNDGECPTLIRDGESIAMVLRRNPHGFPVDVCQARIPFDKSYEISWNGQLLPAARRNPGRIAVLGDSGCTGSDCAAGQPAEPFRTIAALVAELDPPPDVLLHMGDYNYRGTSSKLEIDGETVEVYDVGDNVPNDPQCQLDGPYYSQNAGYIPERRDSWEDWRDDFFMPAGDLLNTAPWVFGRGNHELCSRAGPGFFYFLDPSSDPPTGGTGHRSCPPQGDQTPPEDGALAHALLTEPYAVDLGSLRIAVFDSANACDNFAPERLTAPYTEQLAEVLSVASAGMPTWTLSHRPFIGAVSQNADGSWTTINHTLQASVKAALDQDFGGVVPAGLQLALAGHMHTIEVLTPEGPAAELLPQIVMGGSGVELAGDGTPDGSFTLPVGGIDTNLLGIYDHGYLDIRNYRSDGSWDGTIVATDGSTLAECASANLPDPLCGR